MGNIKNIVAAYGLKTLYSKKYNFTDIIGSDISYALNSCLVNLSEGPVFPGSSVYIIIVRESVYHTRLIR